MYGSISDLPRFHTFQDALYYYNNTKGIRGRTYIRPLKTNRRNPDAYKIEMVGDEVRCYLYRTPVLIYTPTQIIVNTYDSRSTCDFINNVGPCWLGARMQSEVQRIMVRTHGEFISDINNKAYIPVDASYLPTTVQAAKLNEVVLNKTRAAEARKKCKDVVDLAIATSKLDGYWQGLVQSDEVTDDLTLMWLRGLLKCMQYWVSASRVYHYVNGASADSQEGLIPALKKYLYTQQYREHGCYDKIPAPYGVIPNNYEVA